MCYYLPTRISGCLLNPGHRLCQLTGPALSALQPPMGGNVRPDPLDYRTTLFLTPDLPPSTATHTPFAIATLHTPLALLFVAARCIALATGTSPHRLPVALPATARAPAHPFRRWRPLVGSEDPIEVVFFP